MLKPNLSIVWDAAEGRYVATSPGMPAVRAYGRNWIEASEEAEAAWAEEQADLAHHLERFGAKAVQDAEV